LEVSASAYYERAKGKRSDRETEDERLLGRIADAKRRGKAWRTTKALVEGALFFSFVIDAFSRKVVGWQLASHMRTDLVLDALRMALGQRRPGADFALVAHTDRGSQYTSADYTQELDDHGVLASVGSVGDAYDNAMAESFVDTAKTELIADRVWRTRSQLELAVVEYVAWFNNDRLHDSLGDVSPGASETGVWTFTDNEADKNGHPYTPILPYSPR
jgi:transposase InsO family protein